MADISLNNRTGLGMSPVDAPRLVEAAQRWSPDVAGDLTSLETTRMRYSTTSTAMGHVPAPTTFKGMATTVAKFLQGKNCADLIDRLGQRLAFERSGVRLYDAMMVKVQSLESWEGGPHAQQVQQIRRDEAAHAKLIERCISDLGADPTVLTPAANCTAVASQGFIKVLTDPRSSLPQCVDALLNVEVVDVAGWEILTGLADNFNLTPWVETFTAARRVEALHAQWVRGWLTTSMRQGVHLSPLMQ